jgi:hypothetical protein
VTVIANQTSIMPHLVIILYDWSTVTYYDRGSIMTFENLVITWSYIALTYEDAVFAEF